jgi:hypothetical protein
MSRLGMPLIAAVITALLIVFLKFGTINPCGIVREQVRQEGGILVSLLPDSAIDAMIVGQNGPLSPGRCMTLAFTKVPVQSPPQPRPSVPVRRQTHQQYEFSTLQNTPEMLEEASVQAGSIVTECINKRLSGELRSHVASAQCSNPRIIETFQRVGYRYMDLIFLMTAKRLELAEMIDQGKLTEAQGQLEFARLMTEISDRERQRDRGAQ